MLFLILGNSLNAQTNFAYGSINSGSSSLTSPSVNGIEKNNLSTIDHYTGKVDVSLPIYTIKTGNITYPINLVYNTGGIKVDQLASDVGLGFIIPTALITRTINHANDFDNTGSLELQTDYNTYSQDDKDHDIPIEDEKVGYFLAKETDWVISHISSVDYLPDTYHFYSGNGQSTNFFFEDLFTPVEINPKGTKIEAIASKIRIDSKKGNYNAANSSLWEPVYNFLTHDFFTIKITTNEGIQYTFSDCDYSMNQLLNGKSEIGSPAQISAWHITKIEDLRSGKKIEFVYDITSSNPNKDTNSYFKTSVAEREFSYSYNTHSGPGDAVGHFYNKDVTVPFASVHVQKKRLKKIIFDEGEIEFNYNNNGVSGQSLIVRNDVYNADCLTQIYIKDANAVVKAFNFNYDYFSSNHNVGEFNPDAGAFNTYRYNRLKLLSFGETGKPLYKFSYDETNKLPAINSFSIDFLGYYNNSPDVYSPSLIVTNNLHPTLYHYNNQFEKSLLPYKVDNTNPTTIPGYFDRKANNYSKTWSLIKIEYPTGGSVEYQYETNKFEEFGETVDGGGIRISQQKVNDGKGNSRIFNYTYLKTNGISSGTLSSRPYFGFSKRGNFQYSINYSLDPSIPHTINSTGPNTQIYWQLYDKSNLNADITSGAYVGYSRVIESEVGNGKTEFLFTSNDLPGYENKIYRIAPHSFDPQYAQPYHHDVLFTGQVDPVTNEEAYKSDITSDYAIGNSAIYSDVFTDNSYKRGKTKEINIYNETNQLLKKVTFNYTDNVTNTYTFHQGFVQVDDNYPMSQFTTSAIINGQAVNIYDFRSYLQVCMEAFVIARKDIKIAQFQLTSTVTNTYDVLGNANTQLMNYTYTPNGAVRSFQTTTSDGDSVGESYYYPQDSVMSGEANISNLVNSNVVSIPLKTESYRSGTKIFEEKIVYAKDATTSNLLMPKYLYGKKGADFSGNVLEKKMTYNSYDSKGNITESIQENGIPVSYIWGYNKTKLVAKLENIAYVNIPSNLISDIQNASNIYNNENNILNALNSLRTNSALSAARITTFTYKPFIGLSTVTDFKGDRTTYTYDTLNRLQFIKDNSGNIVTEKQYNYKP